MTRLSMAFAVLVATLAGCRSESPLAPADAAIADERLIGVWDPINDVGEREGDGLMIVMPLGRTEFLAGRLALGDEFLEPEETYRLYLTEHQSYRFLNVQVLGERDDFYFLRVNRLTEDEVELQMLPEDVFPSEEMTSAELVEFLVGHADDPEVFSSDGILRYRRLGDDLDFPWPRADEFEVRFGLVDRSRGLYDETTTIPLSYCESFRFGFEITPPDGASYDYYTVHEFPSAPRIFSGTVLDPGPPFRLQLPSTTARSGKLIVFSFSEGDPHGAYRSEIHINRELALGVDYQVTPLENPNACDE